MQNILLLFYTEHHKYNSLFFALCFLFLFACSHQTTPTGGPKDEDPPALISSIPKNGSTNYNAPLIQLDFNEYIKLNSPTQEILIVPSIGKDISYSVKRKSLIIKPKSPWQDSTTYSVSVRGGVKDLTEGNTPENLKISFSTGPFIDSLFVVGRANFVRFPLFPKNTKITVALYQADTFDIFKHTPYYFTETDEKGRFILQNLKGGTYYIYAFNDNNKNMTVESKTESYGFLAEPILTTNQLDSVIVPVVKLDARQPKINTIRNRGRFTKIIFNKPIVQYQLKHVYDSTIVHSFGDNFSEIKIYNPHHIEDSIQFKLKAQDSLEQHIDTVFYIKQVDIGKNFVADDFVVTIDEIKTEPDSSIVSMAIKLSKPLKKINYDSIFIPIDSSHVVTFNERNFTYDSIYKKLHLSKNLFQHIIKDSLLEKQKTTLFFGKGFIISIENDSSKTQKKTIPFVKKEETGTLLVEVNSDKPHYTIQLLSEKNKLIESVSGKSKYSFKNLPVQNYKLQVIIDKNNNQKWDAGNIYKKEEPENIFFYKTLEDEYTIPIRANWELGPLMLIF